MCLVALNWDPGAQTPLMLVANRDEFRARPTQPMHWWSDQRVEMLAGRDLQAGGTWFAIDRQGRFALVTNIRPGYVGQRAARSRGELPIDFIQSGLSIPEFHKQLLPDIGQFGGFNLLLGSVDELFWFSSDHPVGQILAPGIHVLSNDALNTPWPKVRLAREQVQAELPAIEQGQLSLKLLSSTDQFAAELLPHTGVPLEWEQLLSAQTIRGQEYGTRSRSWLHLRRDGQLSLAEAQLDEAAQLHSWLHFDWQA